MIAPHGHAADGISNQVAFFSGRTRRILLRPASLNFGKVAVGREESRTVIITNSAVSTVTLMRITCQGNDFSLSGLDLPLTLASGESFTFTVTFAPRSNGERTGNISLLADALTPILQSAMNGTGVEASGLHAASATDFGRLPVGASGNSSVAIKSLNGGAIVVHGHRVDLSWKASISKNVIGYNVYRANKSSGPFIRINSVLDGSTIYTDNNVDEGKTYYYATTAVNSKKKESRYSNKSHATIPYTLD